MARVRDPLEGRPRDRVVGAVGALLMLAGFFHLGVFAVDGGGWQGPLSWRKPATFGLSFGITVVTVTWLTTFLVVSHGMRRVLVVPTR
jgi:hypothetical protein